MKLEGLRVTIIGLGLMGGSLARALRPLGPTISGTDHDPETLRLAQQLGVIDRASPDLEAGLKRCELAVLAVPVRACVAIIERLGRDLPIPPRLLDLGSTKAAIVDAMRNLPPECDPIGGHPMCGKETSGLLSSDPNLYRDATFALVRTERTSNDLVDFAQEFVRLLGAHPLLLGADEHDRMVAYSSHLPYLIASGLVRTVEPIGREHPRLWELLGPGFRDTSRLAAGDLGMMIDILSTNRAYIEEALAGMTGAMEELRSILQNEAALGEWLESARLRRRELSFYIPGSQM
jgi:prephenate dehydrogenase